MMGTALVAVPSCTDTWTEHYVTEDAYTAEESLWELLESREDLSRFCAIAGKANFYRDETHPAYSIEGNDTVYYTFKDILNANAPITLWAPTNDAMSEEEWQKFAREMDNRSVSIVINNAGVLPKFKTFDKATDGVTCKDYMRTQDINYSSIVYSSYYMCPVIEKNLNPAIINIASSSGLCPLPGMASYSGSKAAVKNFTEVMTLEKKYYVGLVCPGFTKTEIFREQSGRIDKGLVGLIATELDKMAYKIYKGILKKRKRMVFGFDAKMMDIGYRWFPRLAPRLKRQSNFP